MRERREARRRGDLLILSGLSNYIAAAENKWKCCYMALTQVGNGARGLLAADDFEYFRRRGWRTHLVGYRLTGRDSVPVVVSLLSAVLDDAELLYGRHRVVWLRRWCRGDVRLLVVMRRFHELLDILWQGMMALQVIDDELMVLIDFLRRLVEHLRR